MLDQESRKTIERYLEIAQSVLEDQGIHSLARRDPGRLHGYVSLLVFDPITDTFRSFRSTQGQAPLRNYVRSFVAAEENYAEVASLIEALRVLEPHFRSLFPHFDKTIPPTEPTDIQRFILNDGVPWPDELLASIDYSIESMKGAVLRPASMEDLAAGFRREYQEVSSGEIMNANIRGAIELVTVGPWTGLGVPDLLHALNTFQRDMEAGVSPLPSPLTYCLKPEKSWRWRMPLWQGGRLTGVLTAIIGGPLPEPVRTVEHDLFRRLTQIGDLVGAVLERTRERLARELFANWALDQSEPLEDILRRFAQVLVGPHRVTSVHVFEGGGDGFEEPASEDKLTVRVDINGQTAFISVGLLKKSDRTARDLLKAYLDGELARAVSDLDLGGASRVLETDAPSSPSSGVALRAREVLEDYRGDRVNVKQCCACFIALAILKRPASVKIRIQGNMKDTLQHGLFHDYNISRAKQWLSDGKPDLDENGKVTTLAVSHLCTEPAMAFAEEQIPGIRVRRSGRDLVLVEVIADAVTDPAVS